MIPLPAGMEEALTFAHYRQVRVAMVGARVGELPLVGGSLGIDSGALIRRRAELELAVPPLTTDDDARGIAEDLVAAGVWLELTWVMTLMDERVFEVPIGLLRAESAQWVSGEGIVKVSALDLGQQVADDRFLSPRSMSGTTKVTALGTLLAESVPGYPLVPDPDVTDRALADAVWDRDRDKAVAEIALALGAWLFWREAGGWRLQAIPDGSAAPAWSVDGDDVMVQASGSADRDTTYNAVSAMGQAESGADPTVPVPFAVAYDDDPASPTFWDGAFGHKPRFYSSPILADDAEALAAATSILSTSKGLTKGLKFDAVAHPGLEPGDVVEFTDQSTGPVAPGRYLIDKLTLPLGPGGMSMEARRVA